MTSPLYATVPDLRLVLDSTDAGTGTAAQLSDQQLNLAIEAGSTRINLYTGTVYDSSTAALIPPDPLKDLCLDLSAWWATTYYSKNKDLGPSHPVVLRYTEAMKVLEAIRDGKITIDTLSGAGSSRPTNMVPKIFTGADSNTAIGLDGVLQVGGSPELGSRTLLGDFEQAATGP
jgi:phage gp36-like protein